MGRWVCVSLPRFFITQPAMGEIHTSSSSSSGGGCGVRLEGTLLAPAADRMSVAWQGLGFEDLAVAAVQGRYTMEAGGTLWTVWESLLLPEQHLLYNAFVKPLLLLCDYLEEVCSSLWVAVVSRRAGWVAQWLQWFEGGDADHHHEKQG
jgi:hypothetical protein